MVKRALLLGECPNPKVWPPGLWEQAPAFSIISNRSGTWLRAQVQDLTLHGWSFDLENAVTLHRVAAKLGSYRKVIALSRQVANFFQLPYVPHPAHWKRFHHHNPRGWILKLKEALSA